jgi:hypothetical protein
MGLVEDNASEEKKIALDTPSEGVAAEGKFRYEKRSIRHAPKR